MSIGPVEINGIIGRTQDYSTIKHNEDSRGMVEQSNILKQLDTKLDHQMNQVHHADNADNFEQKFDAKDKGSNEYTGDGGKQRKHDNQEKDGKVIIKNTGGFDIKI
jgi:hypothetical protein